MSAVLFFMTQSNFFCHPKTTANDLPTQDTPKHATDDTAQDTAQQTAKDTAEPSSLDEETFNPVR